jgi:hypothetical protein
LSNTDTEKERDGQTDRAHKTTSGFDPRRAHLYDRDRFKPFQVKTTRPLREALADGSVRPKTSLLIVERDPGVVALLTRQMCYHHVAQGEMAGEPWLASF